MRLWICVILSLCLCWGCGDPPNSVMEMVLPDKDMPAAEEPPAVVTTIADAKTPPAEVVPVTEKEEEPPVTVAEEEEEPPPPVIEAEEMPDLGLAMEMEAIMSSEGEVHSPIPNNVYEQLWGHWTEAGSLAPRKFYKKFIDADGIAIVGSENVDDMFFQMARHIVLVMTSKVTGLREALSADQPGGITGDDRPFRLVLSNREERDVVNMPENFGYGIKSDSPIALWVGSWDGSLARADVYFWGNDENFAGHQSIIHEMAHAIESAIYARNLVPNFGERHDTAWEREKEKIRILTEVEGEPYKRIYKKEELWEGRPKYCIANGGSHDNASEFWAWYVERNWFDWMFTQKRDPNYKPLEIEREECPNLVGITEDVFPPFSLHFAVETHGYKTEDGRILRR